MIWQRLVTIAGLLAGCGTLAAWQHHEYGHEIEQAQEIVRRQAEAVNTALVSGIRSHRRLGRFFTDQVQAVLDELVRADAVLAVSLASADGKVRLAAGKEKALEPPAAGSEEWWDAAGFHLVRAFTLPPDSERGPGGGGGWGMGWGRGRGGGPGDEGPLAAGGRFEVHLLVDREPADVQQRNARELRILLVAVGSVALACVAVAWHTTVRLVRAYDRAQMLEAETRHLGELGQAAAGLAHETRNPLGLIRGWAQRLSQSPLPLPEQRTQAAAVVEECDRVTSRINHFLAFARPCQPQPATVPVAGLLAELAVLLEPDLEAKSLRLEFGGIPASRTVRGDRELLRQALFNLIGNAVEFSPAGEAIEVLLQPSGEGHFRLEVADRGPGVAAEAVPQLFTPYYTTRANGTGLGLAIVQRIAAAHGWQAGYTPRPGGGSLFWIHG